MSLPSEFVFVPRPSSSCSIFWRRDRFEDEDEGRGRPREHLAEERFMESLHFFLKRIGTMNHVESPSPALWAPSPPMGERDGVRGFGSWRVAPSSGSRPGQRRISRVGVNNRVGAPEVPLLQLVDCLHDPR